ncbi:MAG: S41 family peptidase [Rubripirellula sp.]
MFRNLSSLSFVVIALTPIVATAQSSFLVKHDATWSYHAAEKMPKSDWRGVEYDTKDWPKGMAGFGYGDDDDVTLLSNMKGRFSRVLIRTDFAIADRTELDALYLYVNYDDGFKAYINGSEVTRANVVEPSGGLAAGNHEVAGFEEFVIQNAKTFLKRGRNVLAIEGFNRSIDSSDFSLHPALSSRRATNIDGLPVRSRVSRLAPMTAPTAGIQRESLTREQAIADINELQRRLKDQSSYVRRNRFDLELAFEALRRSIEEEVSVFELGESLQRLIARIGDCHARVDVPATDARASYLPFMLAETRDGIAALKFDRSALVDADYPYVAAIDGVPIERWLDAAATFVANGSPQLVRNRSLSRVRRIDQVRRQLGVSAAAQATVTLRSQDGIETRDHTVQLAERPSPAGRIPIARTRLLDDQIGYLRIEQMDNALEKTINKHMQEFRETRGLIIDVRDNGGGRYGILRLMRGYLTPPDAQPYVTNIATYRKGKLFGRDHLHYRPTFRENYEGWNERQREAIRKAREQFRPEWNPPDELFSEWHYMVIEKTPGVGQYHYDRHVVVLCNAGSFSATDGFLSCMADTPGVILLGGASGGGSGATRRFTLPESGIRVALSSMASFRPNGRLFDGNGVEVDIEMKPTISDFLGKSDTVRSKAIELIKSKEN